MQTTIIVEKLRSYENFVDFWLIEKEFGVSSFICLFMPKSLVSLICQICSWEGSFFGLWSWQRSVNNFAPRHIDSMNSWMWRPCISCGKWKRWIQMDFLMSTWDYNQLCVHGKSSTNNATREEFQWLENTEIFNITCLSNWSRFKCKRL